MGFFGGEETANRMGLRGGETERMELVGGEERENGT